MGKGVKSFPFFMKDYARMLLPIVCLLTCLPIAARENVVAIDAENKIIAEFQTPITEPVSKKRDRKKKKWANKEEFEKWAFSPESRAPRTVKQKSSVITAEEFQRWQPIAVKVDESIVCDDQWPGDILVNRIEAEVDAPNGPFVITSIDVERRSFDGTQHTVDDIISEHLKAQKADKMGSAIGRDEVDRYLRAATGKKDFSETDVKAMAGEAFTVDEMYDELIRLYKANMMVDPEIRAAWEVSDQDVEAYHQEHPEIIPGTLRIQTATLSIGPKKARQIAKESPEEIDFGGDIEVSIEDLPSDKQFLITMRPGQVHVMQDGKKTRAYKLVSKVETQCVPLEQRRDDIAAQLRKERFAQATENARKTLYADTHVFIKKK